MGKEPDEGLPESLSAREDRRRFLSKCGKFAVTVPPAMTVLLSTSLASPAIAWSSGGGGNCNNGFGNGFDCQPPGDPKENDTWPKHSNGHGSGHGSGHGNGNGYGNGHSNGYGNGHSNGYGNGYSGGNGKSSGGHGGGH